MNSFGIEYLVTCEKLLSLEWLHSPRVKENLEKGFHINV